MLVGTRVTYRSLNCSHSSLWTKTAYLHVQATTWLLSHNLAADLLLFVFDDVMVKPITLEAYMQKIQTVVHFWQMCQFHTLSKQVADYEGKSAK